MTTEISVKLKLPLTPEARTTLERFLRLAKEGDAAEQITEGEKRKLLNRIASLRVEVEALAERFDGGDFDVLEKLTSKKSQLAILTSKATEPKKASGRDIWYGLMVNINDFLRPYFSTALADLRAEFVEQIAPMCQRRNEAEQVVGGLPIVFCFQQWMNSGHLSLSNHRNNVNGLVVVMENILAEKAFWTFHGGK